MGTDGCNLSWSTREKWSAVANCDESRSRYGAWRERFIIYTDVLRRAGARVVQKHSGIQTVGIYHCCVNEMAIVLQPERLAAADGGPFRPRANFCRCYTPFLAGKYGVLQIALKRVRAIRDVVA